MKMKAVLSSGLSVMAFLMLGLPQAIAQSVPQYIPGLPNGVKAVLYRPASTAHVGVIIIHRTSNYLAHAGCTQLSQRGLAVLCMNSRFDNNETIVNYELIAQDVGVGVTYLKNTVGVSKVVLFGHSGGGPTTTYYQAVAENGPAYCSGPNKLSPCASTGPGSVAGLTPADAIVLADAHPSNAVNLLRGQNPAESDWQDKDVVALDASNPPIHTIADLDPWSPANGFVAGGQSHYSNEFVRRYSRAQAERMNDWIRQALRVKEEAAEGRWRFPDDDSIVIARAGGSVAGGGNQGLLAKMDPTIPAQCCTVQPERVLKNDGSIVVEKYTTVRLPDSSDYPGNLSFDTGTKNLTATSFLSANAIRATDALDYNKIDWCSSNNSVPCALQSISVPLLITGMGAYYFFPDGEQYYLHYAKSKDKEYLIADGLVHGITPCTACPGGPYTNQVTNYWNYVFNWIKARFGT